MKSILNALIFRYVLRCNPATYPTFQKLKSKQVPVRKKHLATNK